MDRSEQYCPRLKVFIGFDIFEMQLIYLKGSLIMVWYLDIYLFV